MYHAIECLPENRTGPQRPGVLKFNEECNEDGITYDN